MWSIEWHHFQWPWTNPNSYFKVTLLSDAAYPRNGTKYIHSCKWIPRPTQMSHFKRPWVIFSDLTTYSVTQSIARFLCDNWIFCSMPNVMSKNNTPTQLLYKKLSCRRETARCFVSLNILLTMLSRACVSPYYYSIETMSVSRTVSEIFSVINGATLKSGVGVVQGHWKWRRLIDHIRLLLVGHRKYSSMLYHFRVIWRWIIVTLKYRL